MNRDDIIRMAREAGFEKTRIYKSKIVRRIDNIGAVERLISIAFAAGVAAERQRMEIDSIHTCHDECQRPACVAVREAVALAVEPLQSRITDLYRQLDEAEKQLDQQYKLGMEAEREACAQLCESRFMGDLNREDMEARRCAEVIRARGEK
jgi:hypothetical protein